MLFSEVKAPREFQLIQSGTAAQQNLQGRFRESRTPRKVELQKICVLSKIIDNGIRKLEAFQAEILQLEAMKQKAGEGTHIDH